MFFTAVLDGSGGVYLAGSYEDNMTIGGINLPADK